MIHILCREGILKIYNTQTLHIQEHLKNNSISVEYFYIFINEGNKQHFMEKLCNRNPKNGVQFPEDIASKNVNS